MQYLSFMEVNYNCLFYTTIKISFVNLLLLISTTGYCQNDNCANAGIIKIPNAGFAMGIFTSTINNISNATIQTGGTFAPAILVAGQNVNSIWNKFTPANVF